MKCIVTHKVSEREFVREWMSFNAYMLPFDHVSCIFQQHRRRFVMWQLSILVLSLAVKWNSRNAEFFSRKEFFYENFSQQLMNFSEGISSSFSHIICFVSMTFVTWMLMMEGLIIMNRWQSLNRAYL